MVKLNKKIKEIFTLKRILVILIIVSLILISFQTGKFVVADEYWYLDTAKSVLSVGTPLVQFCDNFAPELFAGHTTTYIYYLAFFIFLIPEQFIRFSGIPFFLLNILLIHLISKKLFKRKELSYIAPLLYAINPLALQGTLLLDIDNTILSTALLLLGFIFTKEFKNKTHERLSVAISTAIVLWMKFTIIFVVLGGVIIQQILQRKKFLERTAQIILGIIIFVVSWLGISAVFNYPGIAIFEYLLRQILVNSGFSLYDKIVTILYAGLKQNLLWITLPLTAMFLFGLKNKKTRFFAILSILAFLQYLFSIPSSYRFPKYMAAFLPFIVIVATGWFDFEELKIKTKHYLWILFPGVVYTLLLQDPIGRARDFMQATYIVIVNGVVILPGIIWLRKKEIMLLLLVGICFYTNIFHLMTPATMYNYGENGLGETIDFVSANFDTNTNVFAHGREVSYYTGTRQYCFRKINETIVDDVHNDCVKAIVVKYGWDDKIHPLLVDITEENYEEIFNAGDYSVFKTNVCGD